METSPDESVVICSLFVCRSDHCHLDMLSNLAICCGPPIILQCYEGFTISPLTETEWKWDYSDHEGTFLSDPLDIIREDRKQDSQQSSVCDGKVILSEVIGEDDTCQYCGARKGLELWNKSSEFSISSLHPNGDPFLV